MFSVGPVGGRNGVAFPGGDPPASGSVSRVGGPLGSLLSAFRRRGGRAGAWWGAKTEQEQCGRRGSGARGGRPACGRAAGGLSPGPAARGVAARPGLACPGGSSPVRGWPAGGARCPSGLASPRGSLLVGIAGTGGLLPAPAVPSAVVETLSKSASWCGASNRSPFQKAQPLRGVCFTAPEPAVSSFHSVLGLVNLLVSSGRAICLRSWEFSSPGLVLYWICTVVAFARLGVKSGLRIFPLGSVESDDFRGKSNLFQFVLSFNPLSFICRIRFNLF